MDRPTTWVGAVRNSSTGECMTPRPDLIAVPAKTEQRRWRVPTPRLGATEPMDGSGVLQENRGERGLVLWQAMRDAILWAETPPAERDGLFSPDAHQRRTAALMAANMEASLADPLEVMTRLVRDPVRVRAEQLGLACREIASWAESRGALATAQGFAEAAALVCPADASAAFKAGQIARKRADYQRAERWLRRAVIVGRQKNDWTGYALALSGLGNLHMQRGNFPRARKLHLRTLETAHRHGLSNIEGNAHHDLFVIAVTSNAVDEANTHAQQAFWAYGPDHPLIPRLAHDVAYVWLTQGEFGRSLPVLKALLPRMRTQDERLVTLANAARAAGGAGDCSTFEETFGEAWATLGDLTGDGYAEACLEIARGAASLGRWHTAYSAVDRGEAIAKVRAEARIAFEAESVRKAIDELRTVRNQPKSPVPFQQDVEQDQFANELVQCLNEKAVAYA